MRVWCLQVCENIKLPAALLSRFDLVFVMLDQPDEGRDRLVSEHIMRRSDPVARVLTSSSSTTPSIPISTTSTSTSSSVHPPNGMENAPPLTLSQRIREWTRHAQEAVEGDYNGARGLLDRLVLSPELMRKYIAYSRRYVMCWCVVVFGIGVVRSSSFVAVTTRETKIYICTLYIRYKIVIVLSN